MKLQVCPKSRVVRSEELEFESILRLASSVLKDRGPQLVSKVKLLSKDAATAA